MFRLQLLLKILGLKYMKTHIVEKLHFILLKWFVLRTCLLFFSNKLKKSLHPVETYQKSYKNIDKLDASRILKPTTLDKNPSKWSNVNYNARRRPLYFTWLVDHLTTWVIRTRVVHITNVSTSFYSLHYAWDELGTWSRRTWRLPAARRHQDFEVLFLEMSCCEKIVWTFMQG